MEKVWPTLRSSFALVETGYKKRTSVGCHRTKNWKSIIRGGSLEN